MAWVVVIPVGPTGRRPLQPIRSESGLEAVTGLMTVTEGLWIARNPFPKIVDPRYERVTYRRTFIGGLRWCSQAVSSTVIQRDSGPHFLSEVVADNDDTDRILPAATCRSRYARIERRIDRGVAIADKKAVPTLRCPA